MTESSQKNWQNYWRGKSDPLAAARMSCERASDQDIAADDGPVFIWSLISLRRPLVSE